MTNNIAKIRAALGMARHAAEFCALPGLAAKTDEALAALAELEKAAAPQFVAAEVTKEMCWNVFEDCDGCEKNMAETARHWLDRWRKELGPALGLVEIREPTPEECERICTEYERLLMREGTCGGRDAFDACRAVMWLKEGL